MLAIPKLIDRPALSGLLSLTIMPAALIASSKPIHRRTMCVLISLFIAFALALTLCAQQPVAGMHRAQKHESRHEIDQLEEMWRNAVLKGNTAVMDSLLADDYMAITPNGTLQSKEQSLENLSSGATHFTSIEILDRKVRFYGATALVTCRAEVSGTSATVDFSGSFRYTRVYVRDAQGKWKIVSFEANRIREPAQQK